MKPYDQVPSYIAAFDVCLSVYHPSQAVRYIDSQKVREYLAAGKPTVAFSSTYSRTQSGYVRVAQTPPAFVQMVREATRMVVDRDLRERISLSVADQDWSHRIAEILGFLEEDKGGRS
jgi:hypothetical protein